MGHTKGPWIVEKNHKGEGLHGSDLQIWSDTEFIAVIPPSLVAKRKENANLIAAAPEMLEVLEWLNDYMSRVNSKFSSQNKYGIGKIDLPYGVGTVVDSHLIQTKLKDLIKKARGE